MSPPVRVGVFDQSGDLVTDRTFQIKLELIDEENKVKAEGTLTTESGIATFSSIRISSKGDYRLRASTNGLPPILSDEFEIEDD